MPTTAAESDTSFLRAWVCNPTELINHCICSMYQRYVAVINTNGGNTRYLPSFLISSQACDALLTKVSKKKNILETSYVWNDILIFIIKIAIDQNIVGLGFIYAKFILGFNIDISFHTNNLANELYIDMQHQECNSVAWMLFTKHFFSNRGSGEGITSGKIEYCGAVGVGIPFSYIPSTWKAIPFIC